MLTKDIYRIDKVRARKSFGRAADTYDAAAVLQKQVREEMLSRLNLVNLNPQVILDAGCGPGGASDALQKKFLKSQVVSLDFAYPMLQKIQSNKSKQGLMNTFKKLISNTTPSLLCADIESLPLATTSTGLIWSNLALQWCNDLDAAFHEFYRILQPEGLLMFSTLGPDTLKELRMATSSNNFASNGQTSVNRFIDMHDVGDALVRAGFNAPVLDIERFTLTYDDIKSLMRDLKSIGAKNSTDGRARGLQGRGFLKKVEECYEQFRKDGKLPVTYEVVYGHAWRGKDKPSLANEYVPVTFKPRIN